MNCDRMRQQIPECLAGRLNPAAREELLAHLEGCSRCRADMAEMGAVWRGLASIPTVEPDAAVRTRFREVLEAYQAGMGEGHGRMVERERPRWLAGWWPAAAVWQTALALALLAAGAAGGRYLGRPRGADPEIALLQRQLDGLRQVVTQSMLQDQSPSSRIRAVGYTSQVARPDRDTVQALLHAVSHDSNVNVRLSAVDALEKMAGNPEVQRALADALPLQDSPLVQMALIDVLVGSDARGAVAALRQLAANPRADESVRRRAAAGAEKLEVRK